MMLTKSMHPHTSKGSSKECCTDFHKKLCSPSKDLSILIRLLILILILPQGLTKKARITYELSDRIDNNITEKRVNFGRPDSFNTQLRIINIQFSEQTNLEPVKQNSQVKQCAMINAANFLLPYSLESATNLMKYGMSKVFIISAFSDKSAENFIAQYFPEREFRVTSKNVTVDAHYNFLDLRYCTKIVYLQTNTIIQENTAQRLMKKSDELGKKSMIYSRDVYRGTEDQSQLIRLSNIEKLNLEQIHPIQICQYVFIFDPIFLKIVTPLNFAYYNKYTIDEMIIYPIIALLQNSNNLRAYDKAIHRISNPIIQHHTFQLHQNQNIKNDQMCFLSFPNDPSIASNDNSRKYLENLQQVQNIQTATLIVFAPYRYDPSRNTSLLPIGLSLLGSEKFFKIRLRIRANKTVCSLGSYESAHTYCQKNSMMVISRQNIFFFTNFINFLSSSLRRRVHYYFSRFRNSEDRIMRFRFSPQKKRQAFRSLGLYYEDLLSPLQIIRADFFKMLYLWILRSSELQFYETEASYVLPLLEINNMRVQRIKKMLFKIKEDRPMSESEKKQFENLKLYYKWPGSLTTLPNPFTQNSLSNKALKRNAPAIIPKKIHQIWLGGKNLSQFRQALINTLKKNHPTYQYYVWTDKDITLETFPYTFSIMNRVMQLEQLQDRSLAAMVADILRLQILYRYGGIYLDIKVESLKPLDPFLKYEIFFNDMDYTEHAYGDPRFTGNTFMGSVPNSYYLNIILTEIITQQQINPYSIHIPRMTGAYQLRKAFNLRQLFSIPGFGFQLFSQYPDNDFPLRCSVPEKFYDDQTIYEIQSHINDQTYKIGIPCKQYEQAYLVSYKQLGRTWQKPKDKQIVS